MGSISSVRIRVARRDWCASRRTSSVIFRGLVFILFKFLYEPKALKHLLVDYNNSMPDYDPETLVSLFSSTSNFPKKLWILSPTSF
jgi:hypothetical protein